MFKCFSIQERDGGFIKARIPTSSKETLVEPMPVLRLLSATVEEKGGRSAAWMAEAGLSWREIRCVEKGGFSGQE